MFYVPNEEQKVKNFGMKGEANYSCYHALEYCLQLALIFYQQDYRTVSFPRKFMRLKGFIFFCIFFLNVCDSCLKEAPQYCLCIYVHSICLKKPPSSLEYLELEG